MRRSAGEIPTDITLTDNTPEDFANTESEGIDLVNILIWIIVFLIVSVILISSVSYINIKKKANMLMEEE